MPCIRQRLQKRKWQIKKEEVDEVKVWIRRRKKDDNDEDDEEEKEDEVEEGRNTKLTPITWTGLQITSNTSSQFFFLRWNTT